MNLTLTIEGDSICGPTRPTNQDSILIDRDNSFFIVCDGMGGHAGGEIASRLCCDVVHEHLKKNLFDNTFDKTHPNVSIYRILKEALNHASQKIFEASLEDPELRGMGTTASLVWEVDSMAYWAHAGDSRVYLIRSGVVYLLTEDHSYVHEQVKAGLLTAEQAEGHQLSNVITRSIGFQEEEDVDIGHTPLLEGDLILASSDGFHGKLKWERWYPLVKEVPNADELKSLLTSLIELAEKDAGDDNISVVLAQLK